MERSALKQRHLRFILFIWIGVPFLLAWLCAPGLDSRLGLPRMLQVEQVSACIVLYLTIRTLFAFKAGDSFRWELVFPAFDIIAIAFLIWGAGRDPLSNLSILYLLPIVECSESFSVPALVICSFLVAVAEGFATWNHRLSGWFGAIYTYVFIFFMCLICGLLARSVALDREKLAIAKDRERIALEMHDGVQGHLVSIASQLELISHLVRIDPDKSFELATAGRDSSRLAADELRFLVQRLRSPELESGFTAALQQFAYNITQRGNIDFTAQLKLERPLSPDMEHALFRIAQESLTNSIKHGHAQKITLCIGEAEKGIEMSIEDDGVGFEPAVQSASGLGGMKDRIVRLGGRFEVVSSPGHGCRVRVWAPLP